MTTLTATAVITAVDRASAVFARVGANAHAIGGRFASAAGKVARFGQAAAFNLGMPAAMVGAFAVRGEFEVDRLSRQMQALGEMTAEQRKMLVKSSFDTSMIVGEQAQNIIKGQRELIQSGLDPETTAGVINTVAIVAKANAMEINTVAEMGINAARGLGLAFHTTAEKVASIKEALNFMAVVPQSGTESVEGLRESLKYAAPVAGMLKVKMSELGAVLTILADKGFKGEAGGTAYRTMMLRSIAPTKQLTQAYRAAGIQIEELQQLDWSMISDQGRLRERLLGAGIGGDAKTIDRALKEVGDPKKYDGLYEYADAAMAKLSDVLHIGPGDAQDKGILKKVIDQHIFSAVNGMDLHKLFTALKRLPIADFAKVAGIQRTAQAAGLMADLDRLEPLIAYFEKMMPGAAERMFGPLNEGFSINIERIGAALGKMRHSIFDGGFGDDLAGWFARLASSIDRLSEADPGRLTAVGYALAGLVISPAAGFALSGVFKGLEAIAKLFASGVLGKIIVGGGLGALLFGDLGSIFSGSPYQRTVDGVTDQLFTDAPILETWARLKAVGGEMGTLFSSMGGDVQSFLKSFDADVGDSLLMTSLRAANNLLRSMQNDLRVWNEQGLLAMIAGRQPGDTSTPRYQRLWNSFENAWEGVVESVHGPRPPAGGRSGSVGPTGQQFIRDQHPNAGPITVTGQANVAVNGSISGKVVVETTIKVEGPGTVTRQTTSGGEVSGTLNRGESTMDLDGTGSR